MMSLVEFDSFWLHFIHDVAFFSCVLSRGCEENMTGLLAFVEFVFHLAWLLLSFLLQNCVHFNTFVHVGYEFWIKFSTAVQKGHSNWSAIWPSPLATMQADLHAAQKRWGPKPSKDGPNAARPAWSAKRDAQSDPTKVPVQVDLHWGPSWDCFGPHFLCSVQVVLHWRYLGIGLDLICLAWLCLTSLARSFEFVGCFCPTSVGMNRFQWGVQFYTDTCSVEWRCFFFWTFWCIL